MVLKSGCKPIFNSTKGRLDNFPTGTKGVRRLELSPNFGDREGSGGGLDSRRGRMVDHLDPVSEPGTVDHFWQLGVTVDRTPTLLGVLDQLEDHGERGLVRQTAF